MALERPLNGEEDMNKNFLQEMVTPGIIPKCIDLLVSRLALVMESSTSFRSTSSNDTTIVRSSTDSKNTDAFRSTSWFDDLVRVLTPGSMKIIVNSMILQNFDHGVISRFIIYYQKSRFIDANSDERREITEAILDSICLLDQNCVSCKILFGILRVSMNLNTKQTCKNSLECMIGSRLHLATLDDLLVPSPSGSSHLYDVNLVLRFMKFFLTKDCQISTSQLRKVAVLIDSYIIEVAPDPGLKPSKFLDLIKCTPDSARESYDNLYHAINIYLQVHTRLSDDEKISICHCLDYNKLSSETCKHLNRNRNRNRNRIFLSRFLQTSQLRQKNALYTMIQEKCFVPGEVRKEKICEKVAVYEDKNDVMNENEKMRTQLHGLQWSVVEVMREFRKIQAQMSKIMKSRLCSNSISKSLPKLCS